MLQLTSNTSSSAAVLSLLRISRAGWDVPRSWSKYAVQNLEAEKNEHNLKK